MKTWVTTNEWQEQTLVLGLGIMSYPWLCHWLTVRLCKLVTISCPNSIYPLGLLKQLNEFLPKKKKERACKLNLGRNSQRGRCCFPMKHHTPIANPLTLLNSSQSKTFTYNKQRITFSVGIKIQENNSKIMYISRKSSPKIDWSWLLTLTKPTEIIPTILLFEEIISGGKHCTEYLYCLSLTDKLCSQN